MKKHGTGTLRGYFTAEASLLMGIIIAVLVSLLAAGFYTHDRACLQAFSCELVSAAENLRVYRDAGARIEKLRGALEGSSLVWTGQKRIAADTSGNEKSSVSSGRFEPPGLSSAFLGAELFSLSLSWSRRSFNGAELIRKVRGKKFDGQLHTLS